MSADSHRALVRRYTVLDIVRIEDGAFAEQRGGPDLLDLLLQLGAVVSVR